MTITSTDRSLSLVREAPDATFLPELRSEDAKATADVVRAMRTGVLDWECANFRTPEQDMAWIQPPDGDMN